MRLVRVAGAVCGSRGRSVGAAVAVCAVAGRAVERGEEVVARRADSAQIGPTSRGSICGSSLVNSGTFQVSDSDFGEFRRTRTIMCGSPKHAPSSSPETWVPRSQNANGILNRLGRGDGTPPARAANCARCEWPHGTGSRRGAARAGAPRATRPRSAAGTRLSQKSETVI